MQNLLALLLALLFLSSCDRPKDENAVTFFTSPRFNGDYNSTLPLHYPDSVIKRILADVPPKLQGFACESAYYRLREGTSDSIVFHYLDLIDATFPHDTVFTFTKILRGKHFLRQNKYDTAIVCLNDGYNLAVKNHLLRRIIDAKSSMSELNSRQGNYPQAVELLLDAYRLFEQIPLNKDDAIIFETYMDLGNTYQSCFNFASAQIWYQKAWEFATAFNWAEGYKIRSTTSLAGNYLQLNKLDSARIMIDTAFYYQNLYQNFYDEASRHHILAQILLAKGQCDEALSHFWQASRKNLKTADIIRVQRFNEGLGDGYLCQQNKDSAIWFYQKALATTDTIRKAAIYQQLGKLYAQNGQFDLAFANEKISRNLAETMFTAEKDRTIGRLHAENELERREWQLLDAENKSKMTRLFMVIGLLFLSLCILIGAFWVYRKRREWLLAQQEKQILIKEKQLIEVREQLKTQALLITKQKLDAKEQELKRSSELLNLKNLIIQKLELQINTDSQEKKKISQDSELRNLKILTSDDWRRFRMLFEQRHPYFLSNLAARYSKLSAADIRLLLLIKIDFDAVEISNILGISASSVYKSRYRLRKKLNLEESEDLDEAILNL